jgi:hypothetical protein
VRTSREDGFEGELWLDDQGRPSPFAAATSPGNGEARAWSVTLSAAWPTRSVPIMRT